MDNGYKHIEKGELHTNHPEDLEINFITLYNLNLHGN